MVSSAGSAGHDQVVLFHLSDLHIGTCLMPPPESFHAVRSGLNPHDFRLLTPLSLAIADAQKRLGLQRNEPPNVVISGDLTQAGTNNDYATAMGLLHHRWQWRFGPQERWIGLDLPRERVDTVPGNHDHWRNATFQRAHARGLAPDWFVSPPWKRVIESPAGTIRLELFGVDSNSGLEDPNNPGKLNLFAGGALSHDELQGLEERLLETAPEEKADQARVRAIVCHHAFSNAGWFGAYPLNEESREALVSLAVRHDVSAALTGHVHRFNVRDWPADVRGQRCSLKELCCATTLQGTRASPGLQGFWVHQIVREAGSAHCQWTAWKYQVGARSYDLDVRDPVTFVIPAKRTLRTL